MGEERIKVILDKHGVKFNKNITETINKGWKEWSTQATKLKILRAHQKNHQKEGLRFYKMEETSIVIIRDELLNDFYSLALKHSTKIKQKNMKTGNYNSPLISKHTRESALRPKCSK